ncbi:sigma 54-interacting transcriptional regulator [Garciella nitratireducens]|uniref:sigma 54-interacting transcriptional regulator n=1 Tax=Garciella nitratireducens TaxID=218205 RepID=UPI001BD21C55|nr:sigma 54-interacting transcriptional regulator [Garciella nitratireducens]
MDFNQMIKLKVKEIMNTNVVKAHPDTSLLDVCKKMVSNKRSEALILLKKKDEEEVQGIITLSDIGEIFKKNINLMNPVKEYMQPYVYFFSPDESVIKARDFMLDKKIGSLPIWDGKRIIGVVDTVTLRDTYYKRTEELSNQLFDILNHLHEGVCVVDEQGIVTFWNSSAERLYRVKAEELLGKKLSDYFPTALLDKVLKQKKAIENITHSPKKGTYVAISAKPLFSEHELIGAVSSERDITEITKLSMELEQANDRVRFLEQEYNKLTRDQYQIGEIVGKSKKFTEAIILAQQVAKVNINVLITGESGTGKEVFARAIHRESGRKGDFIPINCSAIPYNLLESELFGYEGGAFTGALSKGKKGKFQLADEGTLFLDEIGEMPMEMQAKLLRVLEDGEVQPIGGEKSIKINTRIIAATNRDLEKMMEEGRFREDLYYRLNVVSIHLPPLRERKEDVPLLIDRFVKEFSNIHGYSIASISTDALKILTDYEWKGNIRELKNTIERLVVLSKGALITKDMIPLEILKSFQNKEERLEEEMKEYDLEKVLAYTEKNMIQEVMKITNWNKKKAAEILNIPRSTLYYKLNQYKIEKK